MEEVGKIFPAVFKKQLHRVEPPLLEMLRPLWPHVVGKAIARQCRPVSFAAGTLTLATSCPTWAAQLRGLHAELREEINRFLGSPVVRNVKLRLDLTMKLEEPSASDESKSLQDHVGSAPQAGAADPEPEWSEVLERSYSKYFARRRRKVD